MKIKHWKRVWLNTYPKGTIRREPTRDRRYSCLQPKASNKLQKGHTGRDCRECW